MGNSNFNNKNSHNPFDNVSDDDDDLFDDIEPVQQGSPSQPQHHHIATNANNYSLPTATGSVLGGVKTGSNITNSSGTISLSSGNVTSALGYTPVKNESGVASIRVMTQSAYDALSSKSATTLYIITG